MTDELAIQSVNPQVKRKDNTGLYTVGGAVVGAGAGALANHYTLPKPQYSSLQDLIDEKQDTFDGKVKNASDDTKGVWQKAKEAREAGEKAGKDWEAELAKYQEAHSNGDIIPDDNYKNLEKDLEAKKQAVTDKRAELEKIEADKLKKNNTGALTDKQKELAENLNKKIEKIEETKNAYISAREKALEGANKVISEPRTSYTYTEFGKTITSEGNMFEQVIQRKKSFEKTISSVESHLKDKKFKKGSELTFVDPKTKTVVTRVPKNTQEVKAAKEYFAKAYDAALAKLFPGVEKGILHDVANEAAVVVENNVANNASIDAKKAFLQKKTADYNKALADIPNDTEVFNEVKKSATKGSHAESLINRYNSVKADITKLEADIAATPSTDKKTLKDLQNRLAQKKSNAKSLQDSIRQTYYMIQDAPLAKKVGELETQQLYRDIKRMNELVAKENGSKPSKTWLGRLLGVENPTHLNTAEANELKQLETKLAEAEKNLGTKEYQKVVSAAQKATGVDANITKLEGEIKALEDSIKVRKDAQKRISQISKEVEVWAGKGATIDAAGNIIKADGTVFVPEAGTNLASKVGAPIKDPKLAKYDRTIAGIKSHIPVEGTVLTEEQIAQKAKEAVTDTMLKSEIDAQSAAQKAVDEARAKLPKGPAKTAEELKKEFLSKYGERKDAVNKAAESFKDDIKTLLERKGSTGRLAAWLAGGAVVLGGLGYLLAPKNKN